MFYYFSGAKSPSNDFFFFFLWLVLQISSFLLAAYQTTQIVQKHVGYEQAVGVRLKFEFGEPRCRL